MADRMKPMGMDRALSSKMGAKYDPSAEAEVRNWINQLTGEDIGEGAMNVERNLKDGILLIKLLQKLYSGTANLPPACNKVKLNFNTSSAPFKQMENIEVFLKGANAYGVPLNSLFQTVDLYEGRNMAMVIATILQVGTEAQRNGHEGVEKGIMCGAKPVEKHVVHFTEEQKRAGQGIIGLQAGTNKCASQSGMSFGAARHIADIKADEFDREGQGILSAQSGTNKFASQKGMTFGAVRHIADIRADDMSQEGHGVIGLQSGSNKGASQSGMSFGATRHIADIKADDMTQEGQGMLSLQSGTNQFASQKGMSFGAVRHISDIRADEMSQEGQGVIGLQSGSNQFASQKGMSFGAVRHIADIRADEYAQDSAGTIGLQYGSNTGASQAGMTGFGRSRGVADIQVEDLAEASRAMY